ncbi:MAG: hypothetical protein U0235_26515 [Polyangiaceae bacterium]
MRSEILSGKRALSELVTGKPGEIKARIVEDDGKIVMKKSCPKHGEIVDVMSMDPAFLARIEKLYPGRDYLAPLSELRSHGSSSVKFGRGAVLTVDLTNRCNMMCDPCFMDARTRSATCTSSVGRGEEAPRRLDDRQAAPADERAGGEPALHRTFCPRFATRARSRILLRAGGDQRHPLRAGIEFAEQAKEAGLRIAYLQFDGVPTKPTRTARSGTSST